MGTVRFGILGTGTVARQFAEGLCVSAGVSLVAVGSRSQESANAFAIRFKGVRGHGDYGSLIRDADVDVVYVATPPALHRENALACMAAGKAVLIEKPFATDASEATEIIDAARSAGTFCMEAMWTRFMPATRRFLDIARSGEIGDLHYFSADFGAPARYEPGSHRADATGGGAWLDRGIYGLSMAMALFGKPIDIRSSAVLSDGGCDLQSGAILRFANDRLAMISSSTLAYTSNEAMVAGSNGRLRLAEPFVRSDAVSTRQSQPAGPAAPEMTSSGRLRERVKRIPAARFLASMLPRERTERIPYAGNGFGHEAMEVARCLNGGLTESEFMPLAHSQAVMEASDGVRAGWISGRAAT